LPPQKVKGGGDVAALKGTQVQLRVVPTMATDGGQVAIDGPGSTGLTRQPDGSLTGSFTIEKDGFYHIELNGPGGEHVKASPQYTIDMTDDQAPRVQFIKPGRDTSVSPLEEFFLQARADDDFGVASVDLKYSVNGGPEQTVSLYHDKPQTQVSASHTLYF